MLLTSAFSKENAAISLEARCVFVCEVFFTAIRKLRVKVCVFVSRPVRRSARRKRRERTRRTGRERRERTRTRRERRERTR